MRKEKERMKERVGNGLLDVVFSWSFDDVLNTEFNQIKVSKIPIRFSSPDEYLKSFINPLIEETHADVLSSLQTVPYAPTRETYSIEIAKGYSPPKDLLYKITLKRLKDERVGTNYEPRVGDLVALTDIRPKQIDDLNKPLMPYLVASIEKCYNNNDEYLVLSSKPILPDADKPYRKSKTKKTLVVLYLTNMTTNVRIWNALNLVENRNIIRKVLNNDDLDGTSCSLCLHKENKTAYSQIVEKFLSSSDLDSSQQDAVSSCLSTRVCNHRNTVKLIWGPPGTGKTKTVSFLLFGLWKMKCRTLTCAPTNVALVGLAKRLVGLVRNNSLELDTYGLGDIVLFGNEERMNIEDHEDLFDVFLDNRVKILCHCLSPHSGWISSLEAMICLLEDPEGMFRSYLEKLKQNENDDDVFLGINNSDEEGDGNDEWKGPKKTLKSVIHSMLKENKDKLKNNKGAENKDTNNGKKECAEKNDKHEIEVESFEEFFLKRFKGSEENLILLTTSLYTHLPTSFISVEQVKEMIKGVKLLGSFRALLDATTVTANKGLRVVLKGVLVAECLETLKSLRGILSLPPAVYDYRKVKAFCLRRSWLIFCTVSSSAKLYDENIGPIRMVVIDEAAQLKECESTIPLQLSGVRHAVLVGDERQLPAMVQSKICKEADFGRSLFERLVILGRERHLLEVQYRMQPSISLFPNKEFYQMRIKDSANVQTSMYKKQFLRGKMYGPYSFINLKYGKEEFGNNHSQRNMVEVAVVAEIVARLYKEHGASKKKVRIGCISPYKAQVYALQEKLEKLYSTDANSNFSITVRSVDGFQGGEEDVIIFSTVRNNPRGAIGFLSDRQRGNVALTRARHCLWILGDGDTLTRSGSFWKKVVADAKNRNCFYNAENDKNLSQAIIEAMIELDQVHSLLHSDSLLFSKARWKVLFTDDFTRSVAKINNTEARREVISLLEKLSSGLQTDKSYVTVGMTGNCSDLLEVYKVNMYLYLAWSIDIVRENSKETQVIKVWNILTLPEIIDLAKRLDNVFKSYNAETLERCKSKTLESGLAVPMTWHDKSRGGSKGLWGDSDCVDNLQSRLASISLGHKQAGSSTNRNKSKYTFNRSRSKRTC